MNMFIGIGNLTADPTLVETSNEIKMCNFTLAVNSNYKDSEGKRPTNFFMVQTWRGLAETCARYLHKGSKVYVQGEMQQRRYEDKNGVKKTSYQVVADEVEFLSQKQQNVSNSQSTAQSSDSGNMPKQSQQQSMLERMQEVDPQDLPF